MFTRLLVAVVVLVRPEMFLFLIHCCGVMECFWYHFECNLDALGPLLMFSSVAYCRIELFLVALLWVVLLWSSSFLQRASGDGGVLIRC